MAKYENGESTRKHIVLISERLFYERGYHNVSMTDICKAAHMDRRTLYYHFNDKETIRYEICWLEMTRAKHLAEHYCQDSDYLYMVGVYILFRAILADQHIRRFNLDYCVDYPVYTKGLNISAFFLNLYRAIWKPFCQQVQVSDIVFSTAYGYITSCIRLLCENPGEYDVTVLFIHSLRSIALIWGISEPQISCIVEKVNTYISRISADQLSKPHLLSYPDEQLI